MRRRVCIWGHCLDLAAVGFDACDSHLVGAPIAPPPFDWRNPTGVELEECNPLRATTPEIRARAAAVDQWAASYVCKHAGPRRTIADLVHCSLCGEQL